MILKALVDEDFVNYKQCSMFLAFPRCNWKCGIKSCQNSELAAAEDIYIDEEEVVDRFISNPLSEAVICGGLEPFDSFIDLHNFIIKLREKSNALVIIYTGYNHCEVQNEIITLKSIPNIIVKFGRYIPETETIFDTILGVTLASDNQYSERISA